MHWLWLAGVDSSRAKEPDLYTQLREAPLPPGNMEGGRRLQVLIPEIPRNNYIFWMYSPTIVAYHIHYFKVNSIYNCNIIID